MVNWPLNINEKDKEGELTPLHLAVISGNTRVVRKLLIKGSDKTLVDKQGKTPADLARENAYHNILKMLVFYFLTELTYKYILILLFFGEGS